MTDRSQAIATQPISQGQSSQPLDRVNELFGVLAPIRPVGMNDDMASDWSAVIVSDTRGLTDAQFAAGCRHAKRECSDHRGVLRAILQGGEAAKPDPLVSSFMANWHGPKDAQLPGPKTFKQLTEEWRDD